MPRSPGCSAATLLGEHGIEATVATSFGDEELPIALRTVAGHRREYSAHVRRRTRRSGAPERRELARPSARCWRHCDWRRRAWSTTGEASDRGPAAWAPDQGGDRVSVLSRRFVHRPRPADRIPRAGRYDRHEALHGGDPARNSGAPVLDLGCGVGRDLAALDHEPGGKSGSSCRCGHRHASRGRRLVVRAAAVRRYRRVLRRDGESALGRDGTLTGRAPNAGSAVLRSATASSRAPVRRAS